MLDWLRPWRSVRQTGPHLTFAFIAHQWQIAAKKRLRPSWYDDTDRLLRKYLLPAFGDRHADGISKSDMLTAIGRVPPGLHNHTLSLVRQIYEQAGLLGDRGEGDPTRGIKRLPWGQRDRVLTENELWLVWEAVAGLGDYCSIVRLLILTGCRREEIGGLMWSELNLDAGRGVGPGGLPFPQIELPKLRTKNGRGLIVPLAPLALAQLPARGVVASDVREFANRGIAIPPDPYVFGRVHGRPFSGWSKGKAELDAKIGGMAPWTLHDLRRSYVTHCNELGLGTPWVVEAAVGHAAGVKAGVAGVYNRALWMAERRKMALAWSEVFLNRSEQIRLSDSAMGKLVAGG